MKLIEALVKSLIRVGEVSSVNYPAGKVRVVFRDRDNTVSAEIPMLSFEYNPPGIGQQVLCIFLPVGVAKGWGFCLGPYFSPNNYPEDPGEGVYHKSFFGEAFLKYDRATKTLTIKADKIAIKGESEVTGVVTINGDLFVKATDEADGNITADGTIS